MNCIRAQLKALIVSCSRSRLPSAGEERAIDRVAKSATEVVSVSVLGWFGDGSAADFPQVSDSSTTDELEHKPPFAMDA
jgi:hypothetical protein